MKKGSLLVLSSALSLVAMSGTALANLNDISLGVPSYGGTGCPSGTASVSLSPDAKSLSILFDQYTVEAGGMTGKTLDRKSCNVAIPVHVPQGMSVSIFQVDYRGFNALPWGAQSQFNVEYFFAGSRGPSYTRRFVGPTSDNYLVSNTLQASAMVWSECGKDVILRTNSNMLVRTSGWNSPQALSTVDSADIQAGIVYQLQWRPCW